MITLFHSSKIRRIVRVLTIALIVASLVSVMAFAGSTSGSEIDTSQMTSAIKNGIAKVYKILTSVILPVATLVFAFNAATALVGGEKGMEKAKRSMLHVIIVLACVFLAPMIVQEIGNWFSSGVRIEDMTHNA